MLALLFFVSSGNEPSDVLTILTTSLDSPTQPFSPLSSVRQTAPKRIEPSSIGSVESNQEIHTKYDVINCRTTKCFCICFCQEF